MQRVFDVNNERDVRDLFDILPDNVWKIEKINNNGGMTFVYDSDDEPDLFKINWHDKTGIKRNKPEATKADVGKLCVFYDVSTCTEERPNIYAILHHIENQRKNTWFYTNGGSCYAHCRRLTKEEIENLC